MDHSSTNNPVSSILEIVSLAAHSLFVALDARFFEEALQTFIRQQNYSCAMKLLIAMEERHDILTIPVSMLVDFLEIIQQNLNESSSSYLSTEEEENLMTAHVNTIARFLATTTKHNAVSERGSRRSPEDETKDHQKNSVTLMTIIRNKSGVLNRIDNNTKNRGTVYGHDD